MLSKPKRLNDFLQEPGRCFRALFMSLVCFFSLYLSVLFLQPKRVRPQIPFLSPPEIKFFLFGFQEQASDILWLRALQDFDYCEKLIAEKQCIASGWLFRMLDTITDISPKFRMPYAIGGVSLSVIVNDIQGASRIFDKAVVAYPNDWSILSRAAYHALIEEKDNKKASRLLLLAAEKGAPSWYYLLANRAATNEGDLEFTEEIIRQLEASPQKDDILIKNLRRRLEAARQGRPIDRHYIK